MLPKKEIYKMLRERGWSYSKIGMAFEVTRQAVHSSLNYTCHPRIPKPVQYIDIIPKQYKDPWELRNRDHRLKYYRQYYKNHRKEKLEYFRQHRIEKLKKLST